MVIPAVDEVVNRFNRTRVPLELTPLKTILPAYAPLPETRKGSFNVDPGDSVRTEDKLPDPMFQAKTPLVVLRYNRDG